MDESVDQFEFIEFKIRLDRLLPRIDGKEVIYSRQLFEERIIAADEDDLNWIYICPNKLAMLYCIQAIIVESFTCKININDYIDLDFSNPTQKGAELALIHFFTYGYEPDLMKEALSMLRQILLKSPLKGVNVSRMPKNKLKEFGLNLGVLKDGRMYLDEDYLKSIRRE